MAKIRTQGHAGQVTGNAITKTSHTAASCRHLWVEKLEERRLLATATMLGQEVTIPWWVDDDRISDVSDALASVTIGAPAVPVYPADAESNAIVGLDDFYNSIPNFPELDGIDGSNCGNDKPCGIVIIDIGINDLDHPFFGPDDVNNETGLPGADGLADRLVVNLNFIPPGDPEPAGEVSFDHGSNVASIAAGFREEE